MACSARRSRGRCCEIEAAAILALIDRVDERLRARARAAAASAAGRVIVTGMGKSGIICRKIAATLSSTGTSALFLHPAEAIHGDLGAIREDDVVRGAVAQRRDRGAGPAARSPSAGSARG